MSGSAAILQQFGEAAGIPDLRFDGRGQAVFRTEPGRLLGLEQAEGEILVYAALPVRYDSGDWLRRACKRAHHSRLDDWPVQAALREYDDVPHLLALVRVDERELTPARLQQALEYLSRWLDELSAEP
jgi:type III secretion system chaperone SycN